MLILYPVGFRWQRWSRLGDIMAFGYEESVVLIPGTYQQQFYIPVFMCVSGMLGLLFVSFIFLCLPTYLLQHTHTVYDNVYDS